LIFTASSGAYAGGVLAPNGDVHFIARSATVGQKISARGIVSTYSLLVTTFGGSTGVYYDGVLAASTFTRDQVFSSSNNNTLVEFNAGIKDVYTIYPNSVAVGGVPSADSNEIGTDLAGWRAFRGLLEQGVIGDVAFNNGGVGGIVSTYSLGYTTSNGYRGGVLAPNGDIHFVPYLANRGQKISAAGVVSTYSLVYTAFSAYVGGVLDTNGDLHFVPFSANRGQKININGLVSTYSLVYTITDAYEGGVLAPNGDVHFVPFSANRGQKISASGVVSTYSLVYTATSGGSYSGGVLAPNGDIHFVPYTGNRGQKISAIGVVSTYSLIHTVGTGAYRGGVVAPNGDVHFVPTNAVGQMISTLPSTPLPINACLHPFLNKF
jgi:hypothetical protein